jgi:hypothetical protein
MCLKRPWICSVRGSYNLELLPSSVTYYRFLISMMGANGGAGTAYISGEPNFSLAF